MRKNLSNNFLMENLTNSKIFFLKQGFKLNPKFPISDKAASFIAGNNKIDLMLFEKSAFKRVSQNNISNTIAITERLFSISAENNEEVDVMSANEVEAECKVFSKLGSKDGWVYVSGFWIENLEVRLYNRSK